MRQLHSAAAVLILSTLLTLPAFGDDIHEDDAELGHWDGQIAVVFDSDETFSLGESTGILTGWTGDAPGFVTVEEDEPDEFLLALTIDTVLVLEVVSLDPALKAHTPGFADVLTTAGDTWTMGSPSFDDHPVWHIDSTDPGFDPAQTTWTAVFRVLDAGTTGYAPSEPFSMVFTNLPPAEPFIRGDANADGTVDLADAVTSLEALFIAGAMGECEDAMDSNDDGVLDLADPIAVLNNLFGSGAPLPEPSVCGSDPTDDVLTCEEHDACL